MLVRTRWSASDLIMCCCVRKLAWFTRGCCHFTLLIRSVRPSLLLCNTIAVRYRDFATIWLLYFLSMLLSGLQLIIVVTLLANRVFMNGNFLRRQVVLVLQMGSGWRLFHLVLQWQRGGGIGICILHHHLLALFSKLCLLGHDALDLLLFGAEARLSGHRGARRIL